MQLSSLSTLAGTCLLMFVGSMLAGLAPLFLSVSESQLQTISAVGAGLLIGTALGVILPEGAEAFRTAQEQSGMLSPVNQTHQLRLHCLIVLSHHNSYKDHQLGATSSQSGHCRMVTILMSSGAAESSQKLSDSLFGAVLIAGFIAMLLLDQVHISVTKGKSFQTSPPPDMDNDPEDPWKVQVARPAGRQKHVWVSNLTLFKQYALTNRQ